LCYVYVDSVGEVTRVLTLLIVLSSS